MSAKARFPWAVLGLDGPADDRTIRRAYAARLKALDRDADPQGFETLRSAYDVARKMAAHHAAVDRGADAAQPPDAAPQPAWEAAPAPPLDAAAAERSQPPQGPDPFGPRFDRPVTGPTSGREAATPPGRSVADLIAVLHALIAAANCTPGAWIDLLNDPALDDPLQVGLFERALVDALAARTLADGSDPLLTDLRWIGQIEARFGWISDGLRFARLYPEHHAFHRIFRLRLETLQSKAVQSGRELILFLLRRALVHPRVLMMIIIASGLLCSLFYQSLTVLILTLLSAALLGRPLKHPGKHQLTRGGLERIGLGRFAGQLAGLNLRQSLARLLACGVIAGFVLALPFRPVGPLRIQDTDVQFGFSRGLATQRGLSPDDLGAATVEKAIAEYQAGTLSKEAFLQAVMPDLPSLWMLRETTENRYLALSLDDPPPDIPAYHLTEASLSCRRDGTCLAEIRSGLTVTLTSLPHGGGKPVWSMPKGPVLQVTGQRGSGEIRSAGLAQPWLVAAFDVSPDDAQALSPLMGETLESGSRRVPLVALTLTSALEQDDMGPFLRMTARPVAADGDWWLAGCDATAQPRPGLAPERSQMPDPMPEGCRVPRSLVDVVIRTCLDDSDASTSGAGRLCPMGLNPGLPAQSNPTDRRAVFGLHPDLPEWRGERIEEVLDRPEDRLTLALLSRWAGRSVTLTPEQQEMAWRLSDAVIADYTTLLWDAPWPQGLTDYVAAHSPPQVVRDVPTAAMVNRAARYQPQLRALYRKDPDIGTLLLQDMLDFLDDMELLR